MDSLVTDCAANMPGDAWPTRRGAAAVLAAALALLGALPARAQGQVPGSYALPEGSPKVTATLAVAMGQGLRRTLDIAMTPIGGSAPIRQYDVELSKEMHVIGVDAALQSFVHEHGDKPDANGQFRISMSFPHPGLWHVYADAVPKGVGQQVMRFEFPVGPATAGEQKPNLAPTGPVASNGRYSVRLEADALKPGQEASIRLHLLRDGKPAPDVTPYLGVAAHAVFIDAADLSYVHVHAAPVGAPSAGSMAAHVHGDMTGMAHEHGGAAMGAASAPMPGMESMGPSLAPGSRVPADLVLHVAPPRPGDYVLWVQFKGGASVRTVRFVVPVT